MRRLRGIGLLLGIAATATALGSRTPASSTSAVASPTGLRVEHRQPPSEQPRTLGEADGAVPDGTTVFDDTIPGVAHLDPALLGALREAATDTGVPITVDSGWRSPEYQARLLQDAVAKYGSAAEAARWVAAPDRSAHVSGNAVDVGSSGAAWLSDHGAAYGLCRIYGNEPWHYELRPEAVDRGCPPTYSDPTDDPRMTA